METRIKKRFDLDVTSANGEFSTTYELDKTIKTIKGIMACSNKDDLLYFRGSQKIVINNEEIFPEGYESKLLMSGINVPSNQRFYELEDFNVGNGIVKINFKDLDDGRTTFSAYRVSFYLDCITH